MIKEKLANQFHWLYDQKNGQQRKIDSQIKDTILYPDRRNEPIAERILEVDSLHGMWFLDVHFALPFFIQEVFL